MEIIQIIMLIISFLSAIFDWNIPGLDNLFPTQTVAYSENYRCGNAEWSEAPQMDGSTFRGQVEVKCNVYGQSGGGIQELRKYMADVIPGSATQIHEESVENFEGLPSMAYDLSLVSEKDGHDVEVRGVTQLATNGFTQLRNVFDASQISGSSVSSYVKEMHSEVEVNTTSVNGIYQVSFKQRKSVKKPLFTSKSAFYKKMVRETEDNLEAKAPELVDNMSDHL